MYTHTILSYFIIQSQRDGNKIFRNPHKNNYLIGKYFYERNSCTSEANIKWFLIIKTSDIPFAGRFCKLSLHN